MASSIMHIAVADQLYKKINKKININYYDYILGSIAPDISKSIGEKREKSHFLDGYQSLPNIDKFLTKYYDTLNNSFNLGYFIHLYTDKLFYRDYYPLFIHDDFLESNIKFLDGKIIKLTLDERRDILYNDYINLDKILIDEYKLSLDLFYNDFIVPDTTLDEIPINQLNILIDNASILIQNLNKNKINVIDISSIKSFIDDSVEEIYTKLISLKVI